ncbi:MAG: chromosome segregation protein SMC [Acidobacteria bacterium]|nr:chromosome segregation protein SMC [Acidobacteriota bacterium]MCB9398608.1 chromosome segregation protein SMC [Acidobacteriota bacterium]
MLRLEALELYGFKSFVDKTKVTFPDGTTCIVGPNGCGKSNIADAICWVLGEQSAKSLRGSKMEDVIFAGSANRKPAGYAEVTMTWQRIEALQDEKESRLVVTRRLYRNGDSEYLINQTACRLKDIQNALWDFGMGSKAYSIIEQGKIGQILNAKPQERRTLIEEAAGIAKYKQRRHESELKLRSAEENLSRVDDIISEVQKQRTHLNRQVGKANRYKAMQDEFKQKEFQVLNFDLFHHHQALTRIQKANSEAQKKEWALTTEITKIEVDIAKRRQHLLLDEQTLRGLEAEIAEAVRQLDVCEATIKFNQEKKTDRATRIQQAIQELETGQSEQTLLQHKLAETQQEREALGQEIQTTGQSQNDLQQREHTARQQFQAQQERVRQAGKAFQEAQLRQQKTRVNLDQVRSQSENIQRQIQQFQESYDQAKVEMENLLEQSETQQEQTQAADQELKSAREQLVTALEVKKTAQQSAESARQALQEHQRQVSRAEDRCKHFQQILSERADLPDSLKSVLKRLETKPPLLRDLIDSRHQYDAALEWVLAPLMDALVFEEESGLDALQHFPLGTGYKALVLGEEDDWQEEGEPEGLVSVMNQLKGSQQLLTALKPILQNHYIVAEGELADWSEIFPDWTFIDPTGNFRRKGGFLIQRSGKQKSGFLQLKGELAEAEKGLDAAKTQLPAFESQNQQAQADMVKAEEQLVQAQSAVRDWERRQQTLTLEGKRLLDLRNRLNALCMQEQNRLTSLESQREQMQVDNARLSEELAQFNEEMAEMQFNLREEEQALEQARATSFQLQSELAVWHEKVASRNQLMARMDSEHRNLSQQLQALQERIQKNQTNQAAWKQDLLDFEKANGELKVKIKNLNGIREETKQRAVRLDEGIQEQRTQLNGLEDQLKSAVGLRDDLRAEQGRCELEAARLVGKMAQFQEKYQINREEEWQAQSVKESDLVAAELCEQLRGDCQDLAMRIHALGPVNLLALEEFEEIEQRYQFLVDQQKDLIDSIAEIKSTIHKLNKVCIEKFRETFNTVNERFGHNFRELFGGGAAQLQLLDEDNALESGIDMLVQPPGKKLQNVLLMSGGEKAMTAIALLFAIFEYKPSPFCLLDEVDAPLDEVNVTRFMRKLEEMKRNTQFIIITHHKITMSGASSLLGVTMEETGCSKLVSVKFN